MSPALAAASVARAAIELARAGADTALIARSEPELERLAAALRREGVRSLPLPTDLADADAARATVEEAISEFGRVDLLVNSAATDVPPTFRARSSSSLFRTGIECSR